MTTTLFVIGGLLSAPPLFLCEPPDSPTTAAPTAGTPAPGLSLPASPSTVYYQPEETPRYQEWARRAADNERRYVSSYRRERRSLEARILRGDIRDFMIEDYVLQLQVLGDEARIVDLCCRMSAAGPKCREARKRLFKMAKGDLLEARQYQEVLRIAGDIEAGYDKLIEKYDGHPEHEQNWCELRYKGDCASEFHDAFAYFEALVGTERRLDAVVLGEKLIRTRIDPADLMAQSKYTIWELPKDITTVGVIAQLIVSADRAGDKDMGDALRTLGNSRQTEADLDTFREDVLGARADEARRRIMNSVFTNRSPRSDHRPNTKNGTTSRTDPYAGPMEKSALRGRHADNRNP